MFIHLEKLKEGYFKHMKDALYISSIMFVGSIKVFIHALYPDIFESVGSDACRKIIKIVDDKKKLATS